MLQSGFPRTLVPRVNSTASTEVLGVDLLGSNCCLMPRLLGLTTKAGLLDTSSIDRVSQS